MRARHWRVGNLAFLILAAAVGLAACSGSGSPGVASLGNGSGNGGESTTATTPPTGNPSHLLDEWAACMRRHGDPNQPDPIIDANKVIDVTFPNSYQSTDGGLGGPCAGYMTAAQTSLRGGKPVKSPDQADLVKFAVCMRASGISDFPDPSGKGLVLKVGGDLNPSNPKFQKATKECAQKTGLPIFGGSPQPGEVKVSGGGPPCNANRAAAALRRGDRPADRNQAELVTFAEC